MACPDDHPDDKIGKENCRAWCPKYKIIWAAWHWTDTDAFRGEDLCCMHADPPPSARTLVREPAKRSLLARIRRHSLGLRSKLTQDPLPNRT